MSDGIPFGSMAPAFPGGMDPDQLAAVLRAIQSGQGAPDQPAAPAFDSPLVAALGGAPSMNAGQMPAPSMPAPQQDAPPPAQIPSMLGAPAPAMTPPVAPQAAPGLPVPQATGSLPKPPASDDEEEAPAKPAGLTSPPLPPSRPSDLSAIGYGSPSPPMTPAPAPAAPADDHSFLKAWQALGNSGIGDQLLALSAGLLSGGGAEGWSRGISGMLAAGQNAGKANLEQAKASAELAKQQRELAGQNQTAKIISQRMGIPLDDASALAMNPQFVQGFLSSQFGAQDGRVRNADGTMSVVQGSAQDPGQIAAAADAGRESIPNAAARAGAIKTAEQAAGPDDIETKEVPGFGLVSINKTKLGSENADERNNALSVLVPGQKPRPMTPDESKAFQGGYFDANGVPHTQAGGVTVNMPPAEKAEQAKIGEARGNVVADQITAGKSAIDRIRTLDQMSGALSAAGPNITTGPLGEPVLRAKQALGGILGRELPGTSATEMFNNMGPILAGEAARAITNRPAQIEFTTMLNSKPGLMNSVEGNRAMMDVMRQRAVQDSELANIAARSGSTDEYLKRKDEYEASHPMINPFTGQPFGSASTPGSNASADPSSGPIVQVRTASERDGLPTGARYIAPDGKLRIKQ